MLHESHNWRYSDSSQYDAVCTQCNCTDNSQLAKYPCGSPPNSTKFLEFAKQAGLKGSSEVALSPQEQMFAELIVKECSNVCEDTALMFDIDVWLNSTKKEMSAKTALALADEIKKRFGVE